MTVYVPTSTGYFSDFPWDPSARRAVSSAIVPYLSFDENFAEAFPGTPAQNFAFVATSDIAISAGLHEFCTTSDDGSWLFVDGSLLINNGGVHPPFAVCQNIQLIEGMHTIVVNHFQHLGWARLDVYMDGAKLISQPQGKAP